MTSPREKNLSTLYLELCRFEQNGDYDRALKTINKILQITPKETKAFHCKIVCLVQVGKFEEALQAFSNNADLSSDLYFERAYCYYRLNKPEQALEIINSAPLINNELKELKAQLLYRLERYDESYSSYREIIKNTNDDYDNERQANLSAVVANLKNVPTFESKTPTYEICYNNACQLVANSKYLEAERKLKICEKLCRESLEEYGGADEEFEQELAIIKVQLAYCLHKQGRLKEAQQIYTAVLKIKSDDPGITAVANNNIVVINKDQNIFDSKKKMRNATQEILDHKLNNSQRKIIALNNCLLSYHINQPDICRKQCEKLVENWPDTIVCATVINALLFAREDNVQKAVELLQNLSECNPTDNVYLNLICVHLLLTQGQRKKACEILHNLKDVTYKPAIVGSLVSLYLAMEDETGAAKVFEDTVAWYRKQQVSKGHLGNMWLQAAEFHMRHGHPTVAAKSLEELLRNNSGDKRTIAKLIMAYVQFDRKNAKVLSKKLPSPSELTKNVNDKEIETATWIFGPRVQKNKMDASPGTPKIELKQKKKHGKRKGKLPKSYNAGASPDPERWLPKYERTGYRKKRDRRTKEIIKGSQGTASGAADMYDFSKIEHVSENKEETIDSLNKTPSGNNRRPQQKKKRKGSKW